MLCASKELKSSPDSIAWPRRAKMVEHSMKKTWSKWIKLVEHHTVTFNPTQTFQVESKQHTWPQWVKSSLIVWPSRAKVVKCHTAMFNLTQNFCFELETLSWPCSVYGDNNAWPQPVKLPFTTRLTKVKYVIHEQQLQNAKKTLGSWNPNTEASGECFWCPRWLGHLPRRRKNLRILRTSMPLTQQMRGLPLKSLIQAHIALIGLLDEF